MTAVLIESLTSYLFVKFGNNGCYWQYCKIKDSTATTTTSNGLVLEGSTVEIHETEVLVLGKEKNETVPKNEEIAFVLNNENTCDSAESIAKEQAVPVEKGEVKEDNEKLYQKMNHEKDEHRYAELPKTNYIHTVLCLMVVYAVTLCIEKLCHTWRKYKWVAAATFVLAAVILFANNNMNEQEATIASKDRQIAALRAKLQQRNIRPTPTITAKLEGTSQLINNERSRLSDMDAKKREYATKLEKMYENCTKMLDVCNREQVSQMKNTISGQELTIAKLNDTIKDLEGGHVAEQKQISELTSKIEELRENEQSQRWEMAKITDMTNQIRILERSVERCRQAESDVRQRLDDARKEQNRLKEQCTFLELIKQYIMYIIIALIGLSCCVCMVYVANQDVHK